MNTGALRPGERTLLRDAGGDAPRPHREQNRTPCANCVPQDEQYMRNQSTFALAFAIPKGASAVASLANFQLM